MKIIRILFTPIIIMIPLMFYFSVSYAADIDYASVLDTFCQENWSITLDSTTKNNLNTYANAHSNYELGVFRTVGTYTYVWFCFTEGFNDTSRWNLSSNRVRYSDMTIPYQRIGTNGSNTTETYSGSQDCNGAYYFGIVSDLAPIDYDNPVYSSQIPIPNMVVTCTNIPLAYGSTSQVYTRCDIEENEAFYIQLQSKFSVADTVKIGLNDGVYTYDYLTWYNTDSYDIYSLGSDQNEIHVTAAEFNTIWSSIISNFTPEFTTSVPFWLSNPNAQKYLDAQSKYTNKLMLQAPLFGSRMELFARYYAVVDDVCYVGKWVHWNSTNPSNTEQLSNQYQVDQPFPGYQNNSSDENLPNEDNTYTTIGDSTSVDNNPYSNVIINNNVPNYPDYPTAVSFNHDNILLQFINTAKQLPNFFGGVGEFLTASFTFIPSYIWALIGFGFMCSIVVMIIKVL